MPPPSFRRVVPCCAVVLCCAAALASSPALAQSPDRALSAELRDGFYSRINVLGFGLYQDVEEDSAINPGNLLALPRNEAQVLLRPDFNLTVRRLELGIKPRYELSRRRIESQQSAGLPVRQTDNGSHYFVNEGFVRYRLTDTLLANGGRENLQWGPAALASVSNPFNANNGRNNPNLELPGLDYVRAVYVPTAALTVSAIANVGAGRLDHVGPYAKTYALKADYTGEGHYASVLLSHRENAGSRIGFFGGWNVSDALLLHVEGSADQARDRAPGTPSDRQVLAGGAYTLESGASVTTEFLFNHSGCARGPIADCLRARGTLTDPRHPFNRRRYALLQYVDTKIRSNINLVARLIRNLDDDSTQYVLNLEYELGDHWQLYLIPTLYRGRADSELRSVLGKSLFIGAAYTF